MNVGKVGERPATTAASWRRVKSASFGEGGGRYMRVRSKKEKTMRPIPAEGGAVAEGGAAAGGHAAAEVEGLAVFFLGRMLAHHR
jgi:hypothetical protein